MASVQHLTISDTCECRTLMPKKARPYTEYPEEYFKIVEYFREEDHDELRLQMSLSDATSRRHALYRFFRALGIAYKNDGYAASLSEIANTLVIAVDSVPDGAILRLYRDPLAKATLHL